MKLRHIKIENFRGITNLELDLGDTTVLIGENNTGKTAILDAIRYALRKVRSRRGCAFNAYDFHLSSAKSDPRNAPPISIQLIFREDQPKEWDQKLVARLSRAKILQVDCNGLSTVILKVGACFDPVELDYVQDWEFQNLNSIALTNIADSVLFTFQNEVPYYYLAALRDATKHFDAKGDFWRPFLKESQLTPEARTEIENKLAEVNDLIISSHVSFTQVVERLEEVQQVISMTGGDDLVSVDAVPARVFDILARAQVNLNSDTGAKIPVGRHGEGTQSLAVLMLFNAFLQAWNTGIPIVALEEPEAHLHPNAVRALWHLIERIPGQKIISTHSGDLLSEVPLNVITRLYKRDGAVVASRLKDVTLDPDDLRKFNFHIRRARGELLFARCWILGEGETEATLIRESARIMQKDLEQAGVRLVTYQTGISLDSCLKIANGMGIHWIILADNDEQGAKDRRTALNYLNGRLEQEALFMMPERNIEQYLCTNGFSDIYYGLLGDQPRQRVTAQPHSPEYAIQIADALPNKLKTHAVQEVAAAMCNPPHSVPHLFQDVIEAALNLSEAP